MLARRHYCQSGNAPLRKNSKSLLGLTTNNTTNITSAHAAKMSFSLNELSKKVSLFGRELLKLIAKLIKKVSELKNR